MTLKETLLSDMKDAMREKDTIKKNTITMLRAAILQIEKDKKIELTDEDILEVVAKQIKQRKDPLADFEKSGREDLIEAAQAEIAVLMKYMPEQLSKEALTEIIKKAIKKTGAADVKQMGQIMGEVMPQVKGKADGKTINEIARELLNK